MGALIVEADKLRHNARVIFDAVAPAQVIGVVKGNGYGLGLIPFAKILKESGVTFFAVARLSEGLKLREAGFFEDILLLSPVTTPKEAQLVLDHKLIATISSYDNAVLLNGIAQANGQEAHAHVKFDTGFGRFGFLPSETEKVVSIHQFLKNVLIDGVYTHCYSSFGKEETVVGQYDQFLKICNTLKEAGVSVGLRHMANSCAALRFPATRLDAVRIGSAFLGRLPVKNKWGLQKVGYYEDEVLEVKWLPQGHNIGYGGICRVKRPTQVAILNTGYHDGFFVEKSKDTFRFLDVLRYLYHDVKRFFGKKTYIKINGNKYPVLGRVAMCSFCADITGAEVSVGDPVRIDVNPLYIDSAVERKYVESPSV